VVRASGMNFAQVEVLWVKELGPVAPATVEAAQAAAKPLFDVQWKGPQNKFCVVRLKDKRMLKTGLPTVETGREWLASHLKAMER
jgi:hypothetical protein